MAISVNGVKSAAQQVVDAGKVAQSLNKTMGRNSVARMGKESTLQFPVLLSSNMNSDEAMAIARALEKEYAAWCTTMFSLNPVMDLDKYASIADFIKSKHNNDDISTNFKAAGNALESATGTEEEVLEYTLESATASVDPLKNGVGLSCWDIVEEQLDSECLNDIYKPYERTAKILTERLDNIHQANEAFSDDLHSAASTASVKDNANNFTGLTPGEKIQTTVRNANGSISLGKDGKPIKDTAEIKSPVMSQWKNAIVNDPKISALDPTLINVQIVAHGNNKSGPNQFVYNLTLGVKTMIRMVRSDLLVANIADACKNSNLIFKFIKWTKGEINVVTDLILGISDAKANASNDKYENRFIKAALKRKHADGFGKFLGNRTLPNLTVILTSAEIVQVQSLTGIDLTQLHNVLQLINKYYFLAFGIYDTEAQTLQICFDGDDDFSWTTINAMKSSANKTVDLKDTKEILKLMGRV